MVIVLIWVAVIFTALWLYFRQVYSTFRTQGIKHFKPVPLLGNMSPLILRTHHFADDIHKLYTSFPNERFVGRYEFMNEMIMIRDIELLKKVTVKDFEHFLDHRLMADDQIDSLFGRNLFSLKGQEWKDMRSTLSPAFTSSKMRLMVPFMVEVGDHMIKALKKKIKDSEVDYLDVDCKDLTARYANDVIASCAFGLKVDSHNEEDNDFYAMGKVASTFKFRQFLMFFMYACFPKIMKYLKLELFSQSVKDFFRSLVMNTMKDRETRHIVRPDMIHLLMEAKKGQLVHDEKAPVESDAGFATVEESSVGKKSINRTWSDDDLIAQAVLFFIAGFETVSSAMSFLLHELALNPEVQERLAQEIRDTDAKTGGKFDYNTIQNLPYLDMVVSELLRLWPPAVGLDRLCIKDYNLGKANSDSKEDFIVRKGSGIIIPVWSFHRDPQYFPDPLKFDPDRFSDENKHNIKPFTYSPFGLGPRNCIELLRLWPPAVGLDRLCIKDYNLGKANSDSKEDFIVRKGSGIIIPVWSFHRDPQYFPDPLKFDPDRFSDENKHNIKPFTYSPFGLGPRNCIGSRFALCEVKILAFQLLQHMELSPCEKTTIPSKLSPDTFNIKLQGGHWLRLKIRN